MPEQKKDNGWNGNGNIHPLEEVRSHQTDKM